MIDARAEGADVATYEAVVGAVRNARGARLPMDPKLAAALAGRGAGGAGAAGDARGARARQKAAIDAYAALRCADVGALVEDAAFALLVAAEIAGVRDKLVHLFSLALLCADQAGDRAGAAAWVHRLRALQVGTAPPGVPADVWAKYPEIDATSNSGPVTLHIVSEAGATIWVDLRQVGTAPVDIALPPGGAWVLVRSGARAAIVKHTVTGKPARQELTLALPPAPPAVSNPWISLADRVRAWRRGGAWDGKVLAQAMRDAGVVLTVVLVSPSGGAPVEAQVWSLASASARATGAASAAAVRVASVEAGDTAGVTRAVDAALAAMASSSSPTSPAPAQPAGEPQRWYQTTAFTWISVGALVLGAGLVFYAAEGGDTVQRIEVTFP